MNPLILLGIAVLGNVTTNIFLKRMMAGLPKDLPPSGLALYALTSPNLWIAVVGGATLLLAYVASLRTIDLSMAYAWVTSGALFVITLTGPIFLRETLTIPKLIGVALIIVGIVTISAASRAN